MIVFLGVFPKPGYAGGEIAFISNRSGHFEIWIMDEDGSNQAQLTDLGMETLGPRWSPEGLRIAFISGPGGESDLYVMDEDGSNITQIVNRTQLGVRRIQDVSWSPDGTRIAFATGRGCCSGEVWIVDADGSNLTRLFMGSYTGMAEFSADGSRIAFNSRQGGLSFAHPLRVMDADGSNVVTIIPECCSEATTVTSGDWAPHPLRLVVTFGHNIWTLDPDGSNRTQLTFDGSYPPSPFLYEDAAWSPDLSKIIFRRSGPDSQIFVMEADGSSRVQLTQTGSTNIHPDWRSPTDSDDDGIVDSEDNCLEVANPLQQDLDEDGEGDACDADDLEALCRDVTVLADDTCRASAIVDNGSFDPDGDLVSTSQAPTGPYGLGDTLVVLTADDGEDGPGPDDVPDTCEATVSVADVTPPVITASLDPAVDGDDDSDSNSDDSNRGGFVVMVSALDNCDPSPTVTASLEVPGCGPLAVDNHQVFSFEADDDECEVETDDGILEIEGPTLELVVTALDAAGNSARATAGLGDLGGDSEDSDSD